MQSTHIKESSKDIFAATVAAFASTMIGQPFDTVKVRMQSRPTEFTSAIKTTVKTFRLEGLGALWKGSLRLNQSIYFVEMTKNLMELMTGWQATLTGMMLENALAFGMNKQLERTFPSSNEEGFLEKFARPLGLGGISVNPSLLLIYTLS